MMPLALDLTDHQALARLQKTADWKKLKFA